MFREDITFCANSDCKDLTCKRNMKNIKTDIPHSFSIFQGCPKWREANAVWLTKQMEREEQC